MELGPLHLGSGRSSKFKLPDSFNESCCGMRKRCYRGALKSLHPFTNLFFLRQEFFTIMCYHSPLSLYDPTSNLIRQYNFPVPLWCRTTSDTVFVVFVRPLSEHVRRFSSCSTDFSQQITQVVLFLFLYVFLFYNCRIITSNPPTSLPPKTNKSWGVCGWQKNWK
jgi:hypothetical protein